MCYGTNQIQLSNMWASKHNKRHHTHIQERITPIPPKRLTANELPLQDQKRVLNEQEATHNKDAESNFMHSSDVSIFSHIYGVFLF